MNKATTTTRIEAGLLTLLLSFGAAQAQQEGETQPEAATHAPAITEYSPVTDERLLNPEDENWLMYRRTYDEHGYSPLSQISSESVGDLVPVWSFSSGVTHNHEAPPIVNDGIMYVTTAFNGLYALDAATGRLLWSYVRELPEDVFPEVCCDVVNRGVGLYGDKVYMTTLDTHLLAFDAKTGEIVWDAVVDDYLSGSVMTLSPLIVRGHVMVGIAGGEYGVRGFVAAYDSESGEEVWKTYTIPGPGEEGHDTWPGDTWMTGGAPIWVAGSYDPELNLSYWGTGNGGPWMGSLRPGDNLYVASMLAINPDSGEIEHHFQYMPNETWDYDEVAENILIDLEIDGKPVKGVAHVGRNGYLYMLDRTNLDLIYAEPVVTVDWASGYDENGRPIVNPDAIPDVGKEVSVCPIWSGPKNWNPAAYSPDTGLLYSSIQHMCMKISGSAVEYRAGQTFIGATTTATLEPNAPDYTGEVAAFDPATGQRVWSSTFPFMRSSILVTGGNLVFAGGTPDRYFRAFDATTGDILWSFPTSSGVYGVPSTYEVDGVQYVAVWSGWNPAPSRWGLVAQEFGLNPEVPQGGALWVFALHGQQQGQPAAAPAAAPAAPATPGGGG
jgi:alcohol dehydrogenase (cytochrome c)